MWSSLFDIIPLYERVIFRLRKQFLRTYKAYIAVLSFTVSKLVWHDFSQNTISKIYFETLVLFQKFNTHLILHHV